ncbi:ankyrin repeat domain-containing protein [Allohahella sp. A8]|uniref:ankyrin repeat domain-containing protein n=1 Tax=Allohahella sp. A8 TaxID=3141461 RepID=UPI003A7FE536
MSRNLIFVLCLVLFPGWSIASADDQKQELAERLVYAVARMPLAAVESFLADGADPNQPNRKGLTPMYYAALYNRLDVAETLLAAGADVNKGAKFDFDSAPLYVAATSLRRGEMIRLLLDSGADPNRCGQDEKASFTALGGAIGRASRAFASQKSDSAEGYLDNIEILLRNGATPQKVDQCEQLPAFSKAVSAPCYERLLHRLLDAGAEVPPYEVRALSKDPTCTSVLERVLKLTSPEELREAEIVIDDAVESNPGIVPLLLAHKFDPNGRAALVLAAGEGNVEMVRLLLSAGADINQKSTLQGKPHDSPLTAAVRSEYAESVVPILLSAGVDLEWKEDFGGHTALILAVRRKGGASMAKQLLAAGADVNGQDRSGETALMHALWHQEDYQLVPLLLGAGADANKPDNTGRTPLMRAMCLSLSHPMIPRLLEGGANPHMTDQDGNTADMIVEKGLCDV